MFIDKGNISHIVILEHSCHISIMSNKEVNRKCAAPNTQKQAMKRVRPEYDEEEQQIVMDSEIITMLTSLSTKMDSLQESMSGIDTRLNNKIDKLESIMTNRINDVKTGLENRIAKAVTETELKCECNVRKISEHVEEIRVHHEGRLDRLERYSLEKDLIISGVPMDNKDEPLSILGDICNTLDCRLKPGDFISVFRLRNRNTKNSRSVPIVARLQDDWAKQEIMGAYFKKKNLNLKDIGFKTGTRIFINERLTSTNREIFNRANEAKRSNLIYRFYTRRGLVYIQRSENDRPACVFHVNDLDFAFPTDSDRQRGGNHQQQTNVSTEHQTNTNGQQQQMNDSVVDPTNMSTSSSPNINVEMAQSTVSMQTGQPSTSQPGPVRTNRKSNKPNTNIESQVN